VGKEYMGFASKNKKPLAFIKAVDVMERMVPILKRAQGQWAAQQILINHLHCKRQYAVRKAGKEEEDANLGEDEEDNNEEEEEEDTNEEEEDTNEEEEDNNEEEEDNNEEDNNEEEEEDNNEEEKEDNNEDEEETTLSTRRTRSHPIPNFTSRKRRGGGDNEAVANFTSGKRRRN